MINHQLHHEVAIIALSVFLSEHREALVDSAFYLAGEKLASRTRTVLAQPQGWPTHAVRDLKALKALHHALTYAESDRAQSLTHTTEPMEAEFAARADIDALLKLFGAHLDDCEACADTVVEFPRRRTVR